MLDLNLIRNDAQKVADALAKKGCIVDFSELLGWDAERKTSKQNVESLKAQRNKVSAEIPKLKKAGQPVEHIFEEMRNLGEEISLCDKKVAELEEKIRAMSEQVTVEEEFELDEDGGEDEFDVSLMDNE